MNHKRLPLHVEFVGVPGVGKSTLAQEVSSRLETEEFDVAQPTARISSMSAAVRIPMKVAYAWYSSITAPHFFASSAGALPWKGIIKNTDTRSAGFNWFFSDGISRWYTPRRDIIILDQGLIQAYWSIALSEPADVRRQFQALLEERYRAIPNLVVMVRADRETIKNRLAQRMSNPSRVAATGENGYSLEDAFKANEQTSVLLESLSAENQPIRTISVTNEHVRDIKRNANEIIEAIDDLTRK